MPSRLLQPTYVLAGRQQGHRSEPTGTGGRERRHHRHVHRGANARRQRSLVSDHDADESADQRERQHRVSGYEYPGRTRAELPVPNQGPQ